MSVVQELGPGRLTWRSVGMGVFSLLCLAVGLWAAVTVTTARVDVAAARTAAECASADQVDGCLSPVPGHVTESRRGYRGLSERYVFAPDDPAVDEAIVRFSGDESFDELSPGLAAVVTGQDVTGLVWEDEVVAFDAAGERVWTIGYEAGGWTARLWVGVLFLSLGVVGLLGLRRSRGAVAGYVGLGLVGAMMGSIVALAIPSLAAQVVEVAAMVLAFLGLGRWARARAARQGELPRMSTVDS
ncbi:hypothetical protein ACT8ZV_21575 [Nocardioides sp. MAHUQ-72]|uniref:hypothetical protein n=1 Tax=unclassified Nocardioides TaxID=2615069 RepID=UPI003614C4E6